MRKLSVYISMIGACFGGSLLHAEIQPPGIFPIIHVTTEEEAEITSREEYINATFYVDFPSSTTSYSLGSKDKPLTTLIRGRGNSSWEFEKKPYRLKFGKKIEPFGMPKSKHFVLLAQAPQQMYYHEAVSFEIARMLEFGWVPRHQPVELVLNGDYRGVYAFCENVRIDSGRLDIKGQPDLNENLSTIDDGWLVEIDNTYDEPQIIIPQPVTEPDNPGVIARFTIHTPEVLSDAQTEWITTEMQQITDAIYNPDKSDARWSEYLDIESLAKYYIVQELTCNYDAFVGSSYIHHSGGGKWKFGPMWDSGGTFEPEVRKGSFIEERYERYGPKAPFTWIRELKKYPYFWENILMEWEKFYPVQMDNIREYIESFYNVAKPAYEVETLRWPQYSGVQLEWAHWLLTRQIDQYAEWFDKYLRDNMAGITIIENESFDYKINPDGTIVITGSPGVNVTLYSISGESTGQFSVDGTGQGSYQLPAKGIYIMQITGSIGTSKAVKIAY